MRLVGVVKGQHINVSVPVYVIIETINLYELAFSILQVLALPIPILSSLTFPQEF